MSKHGKINFIKGFATSSGIVMGHAFVRKIDDISFIPRTLITRDGIAAEMDRFDEACRIIRKELEAVKKKIVEYLGENYSDIIAAQLAILNDTEIRSEINSYMQEHHVNVAYAYKFIMNQYMQSLNEVESEYFRERVSDIRDIKERVLRVLLSEKTIFESTDLNRPTILVAKDINPTDLVMMMTENVVGFITEFGGVTSHVSILARTLNVPMLVGVDNATFHVNTDQYLILDADHGKLIIQPDKEMEDEYRLEMEHLQEKDRIYQGNADLPAVTRDGFHIGLSANISLSFEIDNIEKYGADGIGLYRTEYLYMMKPTLPSEKELYKDYLKVSEALSPRQVTIRTIDVGGDKMAGLWEEELRCESNPFMGYRAIRICLDKPDIFRTQVRAILRSSAHGKVSLMLPMITYLEELTAAVDLINQVKKDFLKENIPFDKDIQVGMMIETPSAVISMVHFADYVDFYSIGTNDLTQYALAVDRGNEKVSHVYCHYDPAVLKLIYMAVKSAQKAGKPIYICGEMAAEKEALYLFAAMRVNGISVSPRFIGPSREFIRAMSQKDAESHLDEIISLKNRCSIREKLQKFIETEVVVPE